MQKKIILISLLALFAVSYSFAQTKPTKVIPAAEHYEGGQDSMYAFINRTLVYPTMAKRNRIEGECIIKFKLDENGTASSFVVVKNIGGGCGEEAARVIKLLKFKAPGYAMQTSIPVIFSLKANK
jgi:protein TonB